MSEYEVGLFTAIGALMTSIIELGADQDRLVAQLTLHSETFAKLDKPQAASIVLLLANSILKSRNA